jgi:choline dehydrogenase
MNFSAHASKYLTLVEEFKSLTKPVKRFFSQSKNDYYDHIVIGSGSSGSVAARTLADRGRKVLLLEAGKNNDLPEVHDIQKSVLGTDLDWQLLSSQQKNMNSRQIPYNAGKMYGGSSSLNGMVWVHGHPSDYNGWNKRGWNYNDVLPYFKKLECYPEGNPFYRGHDGNIRITKNFSGGILSECFIKSVTKNGLRYNDDYNAENQYGVALAQLNSDDSGYRQDSYSFFVKPILEKENNIKVISQSFVNKINFDFSRGRATGVQLKDGTNYDSDKEIFLCAGAYFSPIILMNSKYPNLFIGKNFHDHTIATVARILKSSAFHPNYSMQNVLFVDENGQSPKDTGKRPAFEIQSFYLTPGSWWPYENPGFGLGVLNLHPSSRGMITQESNGLPIINPNCFSPETNDLEMQFRGFEIGRKILSNFQKDNPDLLGEEIWPQPSDTTPSQIKDFIVKNAVCDYHGCGSCQLGKVVDENLSLIGFKNIKVADASIIPEIISGNTNAVSMMIGLKAANIALNQ